MADPSATTTLFICWSGDRSRAAAGVLADALPEIVPGLECDVSMQIEPGRLWSAELGNQLQVADAGLVCLTPEALESPWVHYEAGMLAAEVAKERGEPMIFTYLLGLDPRELSGPLNAYQSAAATREDTARLVDSLLRFAGSERAGDFDAWWSELDEALSRIPPAPLSDVVGDLRRFFGRQTFVEPVRECMNQNWLGRRDDCRDVFGYLDRERGRVHAGCGPTVVEAYDALCRHLQAYAMNLEEFFLEERQFDLDERTGLLEIPGGGLLAEERRVNIRERLDQLVGGRAPA